MAERLAVAGKSMGWVQRGRVRPSGRLEVARPPALVLSKIDPNEGALAIGSGIHRGICGSHGGGLGEWLRDGRADDEGGALGASMAGEENGKGVAADMGDEHNGSDLALDTMREEISGF